jgi:hypothetical protein
MMRIAFYLCGVPPQTQWTISIMRKIAEKNHKWRTSYKISTNSSQSCYGH